VDARLKTFLRRHTNSVESVWSLLKRSIIGAYHKISVKHLDAYLDELEWRFNNRHNPYLSRDTLLRMIDSDRLPRPELAAALGPERFQLSAICHSLSALVLSEPLIHVPIHQLA
jgi:hypothetical protein